MRLFLGSVESEPHSRLLTDEEWRDFREFLARNAVDDLAPIPYHGVCDGVEYEYLYVSRAGGHRIRINNPSWRNGAVYGRLVSLFYRLSESLRREASASQPAAALPQIDLYRPITLSLYHFVTGTHRLGHVDPI